MVQSANLGFPRIGLKRELKKATESYWKGELDYLALRKIGADLRARHWRLQRDLGIEIIPSNDFSFYDQVLDTTAMLGAVPPRYRNDVAGTSAKFSPSARTSNAYAMMADVAETAEVQGSVDLDTYFAMARGSAAAPAMEMTKWFDTNYHYIVPEFYKDQEFRLASRKAIDEFKEAKALGIHTRPVLVGPMTFLSLGKAKSADLHPLSLIKRVLPVYAEVLTTLASEGADWVQIDEPVLATDLNDTQRDAFRKAYAALSKCGLKILIATYFERLDDNLSLTAALPIDGLHIDLVRAPEQLASVLSVWPKSRTLSLGVIDGRNIWRADLDAAFSLVEKAI
ncbi:MAG: 5-methyltetrahydropteroyltriglutamate--homocysteine S-methyltransferase, partial [Hyphomicrobium denitrificans]|nr:5-methyltetrahydropteroyltriglutamate--homocysteine S-methyltransferase [Hyphomicrobium denitrificans]